MPRLARAPRLGKTARNEKLKLAANLFNTLGASAIVAAFVVPGVAITEHAPPYHISWLLIFVVGCWCLVGVFSHLVAQAILEKLVD